MRIIGWLAIALAVGVGFWLFWFDYLINFRWTV